MKVLKRGIDLTFEISCSRCYSKLEYDKNDIKIRNVVMDDEELFNANDVFATDGVKISKLSRRMSKGEKEKAGDNTLNRVKQSCITCPCCGKKLIVKNVLQ